MEARLAVMAKERESFAIVWVVAFGAVGAAELVEATAEFRIIATKKVIVFQHHYRHLASRQCCLPDPARKHAISKGNLENFIRWFCQPRTTANTVEWHDDSAIDATARQRPRQRTCNVSQSASFGESNHLRGGNKYPHEHSRVSTRLVIS